MKISTFKVFSKSKSNYSLLQDHIVLSRQYLSLFLVAVCNRPVDRSTVRQIDLLYSFAYILFITLFPIKSDPAVKGLFFFLVPQSNYRTVIVTNGLDLRARPLDPLQSCNQTTGLKKRITPYCVPILFSISPTHHFLSDFVQAKLYLISHYPFPSMFPYSRFLGLFNLGSWNKICQNWELIKLINELY